MQMFLAMLAFEMLHISIDTIDISMGETPPGDRPAGSMDHLAAPTRPTRLVSGVSFSELVVIT